MDRRRWLQYERSQRVPDRCLFGAAPQRREEPAQCMSAFLSSREENGEDRCWSAALRLDRFRLAEAPARAERTETLASPNSVWSGLSFNLAVEALQIYFFDDRCYIRPFRCQIDLLDGGIDDLLDFVGKSSCTSIRALFA